MKKPKRHQFKYVDPEKTMNPVEAGGQTLKSKHVVPVLRKSLVPDFVRHDLKRTLLTIGAFILILIVLYVIQTQTSLLKPVLKIFGL